MLPAEWDLSCSQSLVKSEIIVTSSAYRDLSTAQLLAKRSSYSAEDDRWLDLSR